jgi:hypothetical protein
VAERQLRRIVETRPGYDCIAKPCGERGCGTSPGSSHGRHGDEWVYVVTDGDFGVSLVVFTDNLNGGKLPGRSTAYPIGADLSGHTSRPAYEDQIRKGESGQACAYLDGGRCFSCWTSALAASEFVAEHGISEEREQNEGFWRALEAKWSELRAHVDSNRPRVRRCACCHGSGIVDGDEVRRA